MAVVYHFYAHYRAAVVEELARSTVADYEFLGDDRDFQGSIKAATFSDRVRFRKCPCRQIKGPTMWQRGVIGAALGSRYDTIVFLSSPYWPATWIGALVARLRGKRVLFWGIGWIAQPRKLKDRVRAAYYLLAHDLLLYGHNAKQIGIAEGFGPERMHVVFNSLNYAAQREAEAGLPADSVTQVRQRLFANPDRPMVVCTTRLVPHRRLDMLIEALRLLREEGIEANLALVGDGPERQALEAQARVAQVPTTFTGALYREEEIAPIMTAANILVAPGMSGLATMHALGYGVPVITHDDPFEQAPESEAIQAGVTGDLFRRGDVHDLARAMRPWLASPRPPRHVAEACRGIVARFYTPWFQRAAIDRAVLGREADDIFWLREGVPQPSEAS